MPDKSARSSTQVLFPGQRLRATFPAANAWNGPSGEIPLISIIDDNDLSRAAIESLVTSLGFSARTFASADSFLRSSSIAETRCLILDVQMPEMSGLELQDHLARDGVDIPIIFITAYPDETTRTRALNAGAVCFLHKSLDLKGSRLADCLHAALGWRQDPALDR